VRAVVSFIIAVAFALNVLWTPYHLATEHDHDFLSLSASEIDDGDHDHHHDADSADSLEDDHDSHSSTDHDLNMAARKHERNAFDVSVPRSATFAFYETIVSEIPNQPELRPPSFEPQAILRVRGPPSA
jgi:hypothetical protein